MVAPGNAGLASDDSSAMIEKPWEMALGRAQVHDT